MLVGLCNDHGTFEVTCCRKWVLKSQMVMLTAEFFISHGLLIVFTLLFVSLVCMWSCSKTTTWVITQLKEISGKKYKNLSEDEKSRKAEGLQVKLQKDVLQSFILQIKEVYQPAMSSHFLSSVQFYQTVFSKWVLLNTCVCEVVWGCLSEFRAAVSTTSSGPGWKQWCVPQPSYWSS